MDPATATTVLAVLGSAFGVVFATMTTLMFVSIRVQHRDSIEIRTLVTGAGNENRGLIEQAQKEFRGLIEQAQRENRDLIEQTVSKLSVAFEEHQRVTAQNHDTVSESLRDARERLARIEGRLGIGGSATRDSGIGGSSTQDSGIGGDSTEAA